MVTASYCHIIIIDPCWPKLKSFDFLTLLGMILVLENIDCSEDRKLSFLYLILSLKTSELLSIWSFTVFHRSGRALVVLPVSCRRKLLHLKSRVKARADCSQFPQNIWKRWCNYHSPLMSLSILTWAQTIRSNRRTKAYHRKRLWMEYDKYDKSICKLQIEHSFVGLFSFYFLFLMQSLHQ